MEGSVTEGSVRNGRECKERRKEGRKEGREKTDRIRQTACALRARGTGRAGRKIVQTRTSRGTSLIGESAEPLLSDIKKTDDHASLGDEDTEQNRPKAGALQAYELWMATFAHWEGTKSRLKPIHPHGGVPRHTL